MNYLLDQSKNSVERLEMTFDRFAADLLDGLPAGPSTDPTPPCSNGRSNSPARTPS